IKLCYRADTPLLLVGRHGIGKSEILKQAAQELRVEYLDRDLSLMEPPDLLGLPRFKGGATRYASPAWLPATGRGLITFEELNRCAGYMRTPCLQLLTARSLNDYRLPLGWLPCACINPAESEYETEVLDPALRSRFVEVPVVADPGEWLSWAEVQGVHAD